MAADATGLTAGAARALPARRRILVCDDEPQILCVLKITLRAHGFDPILAGSVAEAVDAAAQRLPDAAIVDLLLPDGEGIDVCMALRRTSALPVIIISAVSDVPDKLDALRAGADDYVVKPFDTGDLLARLECLLRRSPPGQNEPMIVAGSLEIDLAAHTVRRDGRPIDLSPVEFDLLSTLARNRGRLMTYRDLLVQACGPQHAGDIVALRGHIARLRAKIEAARLTPRYVRSDPGIGYRFCA
jgi:two-component system KDP operon response regulator KdpE